MIKIIPYNVYNRGAASRIIDAASARKMSVGIPKDAKYPDGKSVEKVALIQEFGNGNILPRPFVRNAIADKKEEWKDVVKEKMTEAVKGNDAKGMDKAMEVVGEKIKEDVVKSLDDLVAPPLKPYTIKVKKAKGRKRPEKPLIDSELLRQSFKVEVK